MPGIILTGFHVLSHLILKTNQCGICHYPHFLNEECIGVLQRNRKTIANSSSIRETEESFFQRNRILQRNRRTTVKFFYQWDIHRKNLKMRDWLT